MNSEEEKLVEFLAVIQLDQFYYLLVKNLHVTRIAHFDHVEEIDLTGIGMSKPEQRRLFEHLKKSKRPSLKKLFRKSFKRDSEKKGLKSSSKDVPEIERTETPDLNNTILTARNNIRQGLRCLIQEKDIILADFIGKGAFGYVRKGVWSTDKGSKLDVAVKCLKPSHDEASVLLQNEFIKEANAMSSLDHPNLIRLYGIVLTTPMMLVTELAPLGSLLGRLRSESSKFMISILCSFVVQIVSGMKYLESNRFIHRDLAARNILLVSYEKIKIGDFGLMRALPSDADYYVMQPNGLVPFAWCATECLKYRRFSHASDVWAFGVTVLEIFSYGQEPWPGLNGAEILEKIDSPNFERQSRPDHCPTEIYKIVRNCCWCDNPEERVSFEALEKMILEVLPKEVTSSFSYNAEKAGEISFDIGDLLTVVEARDADYVKAQNRRTGKVGFIPIGLISRSSTAGCKANGTLKIPSLSSSGLDNKRFHVGKKMSLEPDCLSVASRGSASSSGSSSSTDSKYSTNRHPAHSNPRDIPQKRQNSLSSGVGSSGISWGNSFRDNASLKYACESDYFSHDESSRKSSIACSNIEEDTGRPSTDSLSAIGSPYMNTKIESTLQRSYVEQSSYENTEIFSSSPATVVHRNSSPIAIENSQRTQHQRISTNSDLSVSSNHFIPTLSSDIVDGSINIENIVSLPINSTECDTSNSDLETSTASEADIRLSNSAPTTKSEMKSVRKASLKMKQTELNQRSSNSSKEKWLPPALEKFTNIIDNAVYECMTIRDNQSETYELMKDETDGSNKSQNFNDCFYHNMSIPRKDLEQCPLTTPPLPPRAHSRARQKDLFQEIDIYENQELIDVRKLDKSALNVLPVPPKTYQNEIKGNGAGNRLDMNMIDTYENVESRQLAISPALKTYHNTSEILQGLAMQSYENTDFRQPKQIVPKTYRRTSETDAHEHLRSKSDCLQSEETSFSLPPRTYRNTTGSYENVEISSLSHSNFVRNCYENRDLSESPPPLPRKKVQRTQAEMRSNEIKESNIERKNSVNSQLAQSADLENCSSITSNSESLHADLPIVDVPTSKEGNQLEASKDGCIDNDLCASNDYNNHNLIDDSPISDCLPNKYGSVWDGGEIVISEKPDQAKEADKNSGQEERSNVSCAQLIDETETEVGLILEVKEPDKCDKQKSDNLLRALLSPREERGRPMGRSSSEESPVRPPRRHRDKNKANRRHTVDSLPIKKADVSKDCRVEKGLNGSIEQDKYSDETLAANSAMSKGSECSTTNGSPDVSLHDDSRNAVVDGCSSQEHIDVVSPEKAIADNGDRESKEKPIKTRTENQSTILQRDTDPSAATDDTKFANLQQSADPANGSAEFEMPIKNIDDNDLEISDQNGSLKPRFTKIKSLLSGKVSNLGNKDEMQSNLSSDEKTELLGEDEGCEDDDQVRYVLHFVTPV